MLRRNVDPMTNNRIVNRVLLVVLFALTAGGIACTSLFQSSFYSAFSLKELVQRNQSNSGLNCSGGGAGGGGIGAGAVGSHGNGTFHKGESLACQISDAGQFVEARFIEALKDSVEKDLNANQAKITSNTNPDLSRFAIEYTVGSSFGRVEISGTRTAGYYSLAAQVNEKKGG
jgi:hypothetical protein